MNSCIYTLRLKHKRIRPKKNSFVHSIYMFYLDLDELDELNQKMRLFSYNKWNVFSFFDKDHFKFINNNKKYAKEISKEKINYDKKKYIGRNTKERINEMIKELKLDFKLGKVFILTNLRNLGYVFNPVSFYYCYDTDGKFRVLFSEVNNTFHDQKMYYVLIKNPNQDVFYSKQRKNYYISPFIDYNSDLYWKFREPKKEYSMEIDSGKEEGLILKTSLFGKRKKLTNLNLFLSFVRYPMITFMIIFIIHYQALKLWLKGVHFWRKSEVDKKIAKRIKENETR